LYLEIFKHELNLNTLISKITLLLKLVFIYPIYAPRTVPAIVANPPVITA